MNPLAARLDHVTAAYGSTVAVDDVTIDVRDGEILALLGHSGSGKTTLLNLLGGHVRPTRGEVTINGVTVADDEAWVAPEKRGIGMVFQDYALFPHLTVAGNVLFSQKRNRTIDLPASLARVGLEGLGDRYPDQLSGGQQQRVAIARALAMDPKLLLLDEPFAHLDAATADAVRGELIDMLRSTGLACVIVTHDQEEALAIADRIVVMDGGKVLQVGEPEMLYASPGSVQAAEYLGRMNVVAAQCADGCVETELGTFATLAGVICANCPLDNCGPTQLLIRPELIDVTADAQGTAVVTGREFRGHDLLYTLRLASGTTITAHRPSVNIVSVGDRVTIKPCFEAVAHQDDHSFTAVRHGAVPSLPNTAAELLPQ